MTEIELTAQSLRALIPALEAIEQTAYSQQQLEDIIQQGMLRPGQDEALGYWFAHFLMVREALWEVIEQADQTIPDLSKIEQYAEWQAFVIGYSAACLIVRLDRFLIERFATHKLIQRKLNQAFPEHRIPRKQYTRVFKALTRPDTALRLYQVMQLSQQRRAQIMTLANDQQVGFLVRQLSQLEQHLDPSKRGYLKRFRHYMRHTLRRRGASAKQQSLFAILEYSGRMLAELHNKNNKRVTPEIRGQLATLLEPGDVIISRHHQAATNLFLPGYWPHASLYIGQADFLTAHGLTLSKELEKKWTQNVSVLEAKRDGVRLRPLAETTHVDAVAIIRPQLPAELVAQAVHRALDHEGKLYNFDFDFFRSDRLVCTEVIYRGYDGLPGVQIPLQERAGRTTLSAEDLLRLALKDILFKPIAVFGTAESAHTLVREPQAEELLRTQLETNQT